MKYSREELIDFFADGKIPTGAQFEALINSIMSRYDDGIEKSAATAARISAGVDNFAPVLGLCPNDSLDPSWLISLKAAGQDGLNIAPGNAKEAPFLFLQRQEGKLGLGTQSPEAELEINRAQDAPATIAVKNTHAGSQGSAMLELSSHGSKATFSKQNSNLALEIQNQGGNIFLKGNSSAGNLLIDGANGNVGIGKLAPSVALDVAGDISTNGSAFLLGTGNEDASHLGNTGLFWSGPNSSKKTRYGIYRTAGTWASSNYQQLRLQFDTGIQLGAGTGSNAGHDKSYVEVINGKGLMLTSGRLGIGTISPNGAIDIAAGGIVMNSCLSPEAARPQLGNARISSELSSYGGNGLGSNEGLLRLSAGGGTDKFSKSFIDLSGLSSNEDLNQNISLGTSGLERMRIDKDGRVGIGTSSPKAGLDIANGGVLLNSGLTNSAARPSVTNLRGAYEIAGYSAAGLAADDGFLRLSAGGGTSAATKSFIDLSGFSTIADMNRNIRFGVAGGEKMRLTADGSLGIGVSSPEFGLDTVGGIGTRGGDICFATKAQSISSITNSVGLFWHGKNSDYLNYGIYRNEGAWTAPGYQQLKISWRTGIQLSPGSTSGSEFDKSYVELVSGKGLMVTSGDIGIGTTIPRDSLDIARGGMLIKSGLTNSSTRPAITAVSTNGEIHGYSSSGLTADDGFLRISAGGGTSVATKSFIDLSGYSTVGDMSRNIRFGTSGTERMRIDANGYIGFGTAVPKLPIDFHNGGIGLWSSPSTETSRPAVSKLPIQGEIWAYSNYDNLTNDRGFLRLSAGGGNNNLTKSYIDICGFHPSAEMHNTIVLFTSGTEQARIAANGNLGLGTPTPSNGIDLCRGGISIKSGLHNGSSRPAITNVPIQGEIWGYSTNGTTWDDGFLRLAAGGGTHTSNKSFIDLTGYSLVGDMVRTIRFGTGGNERMRIDANGNVGIGTASPRCSLHVASSFMTSIPSYRWMVLNNMGDSNSGPYDRPVSIWAASKIAAPEFSAFSDQRIKQKIQTTDADSDLQNLMQLRIVDYDYKDQVSKGNERQKGVIAQEVEAILPGVVSKTTEFIPSIYASSHKLSVAEGKLLVEMENVHDLHAGEKVRAILPDNILEEACEVLDPHSFSLPYDGPVPDGVFVYGKEVEDYRTVDYNKLFCINISATQKLVGEMNQLKAENLQVRKELEAIRNLLAKAGIA